MDFLYNLLKVLPSILMGAAIPVGILLFLFFSKSRNKTAFKGALYGFGSFFGALGLIFLVLLIILQFATIAVSVESNYNSYIYIGGCLILLAYYLITEVLKYFSFRAILKEEKNEHAGITFGCGFILAQNLLILGLRYIVELKGMETLFFGIMMIISAVIYTLITTVSYAMMREGQPIAAGALSAAYFLIYAIMLIFSNVVVTYVTVAIVLLFVLVVAYATLPLPFKKGADQK